MTAAGETVIAGAEIVAGHDGSAELMLRLRYPNGSERPLVLDGEAGFELMTRCQASRAEDLNGRSWRELLGS